jgi:DNA invertase Pin-like site-specific DNA recombinase
MFGMLGIFAEFEREMLVARSTPCLRAPRMQLKRDGKFVSEIG